MKYFIASDIHGSAFYCKKLIEAFNQEKADRILLLGDILYHGPRNELPEDYKPKQVIELLNSVSDKILCVRGNCDTEVDQMVLDFPILADYCLLSHESRLIFVTHGHIFNKDNLPKIHKNDILLHGHTHVPACENLNGFFYLNPGSVSIPKDNSHHGYMTFSEGIFTWNDLNGKILHSWNINTL